MRQADMITLSREYGAGAGELAERLAAILDWPIVGDDIPHRVAARLRLPDEAVEECDEHVPGMLENLGNALLLGNPEVLVDPEVAHRPDPERVFVEANAVMVEAAKSPPLIVVGHGAQSLFQDRPGTLHVRLVAPLKDRVRRICARRTCVERDAIALARRVDADRAHYVRQHYKRDVLDPQLYHIQINTGRVSMEDAARIILDLAGLRGARAADAARR